jgi:hypothetical protein
LSATSQYDGDNQHRDRQPDLSVDHMFPQFFHEQGAHRTCVDGAAGILASFELMFHAEGDSIHRL